MFSYFEWFVLRLNEYQKVSMILSALTNTGRTVNTYVFLPVIKTFEKLVWWEKTSANGYIYDIYSLMFYTYRSGYMYIHTIFAKTGLCMYVPFLDPESSRSLHSKLLDRMFPYYEGKNVEYWGY